VLNWLILIGRGVASACGGQQELVLENLALRQQLMAATRKAKRLRRPPVDSRIVALAREMATANPLWGAPRIHGELRMLGIDVSERTVSRFLKGHPRPQGVLDPAVVF
jgi:hypothetical protein